MTDLSSFYFAGANNPGYPMSLTQWNALLAKLEHAAPWASPLDYGMVVNDSSLAAATGNLAAWNACRAANKNIIMPRGTIWMAGPMIIDTAYSTVVFPQRSDGYGDSNGTRVLSTDKTQDAMIIGPNAAPGGGYTAYPRNLTVLNPCAGFGVTLDALSGADSAQRKAIRINYLIDGLIDSPWAHEAPIGIYYYGLIGTTVRRPKAFRSIQIGTSGTDKFFGHWFKGDPPILAGGNASLNIDVAVVEMASGMTLADQCAIVCDGAFSDVHIKRAETSACKNGLRVTGTTSAGQANSNINFQIDELVVDTFTGIAVDIQQVAQGGSVQVLKLEAMSAVGAAHGVRIKDCYGLVNVEGTVYGLGAANLSGTLGTMTGLRIENSYGVSAKVRLIECPNPVELDTVYDFDINVAVNNVTVTTNPYQAAVFYTQCHRGTLKVRIKGKAAAFAQGVYGPSNDCDRVTFLGMESIDAASISGGAANKLQIAGTQVTAQGSFTTAGASSASGSMTVVGAMS